MDESPVQKNERYHRKKQKAMVVFALKEKGKGQRRTRERGEERFDLECLEAAE